MLQVGLRALTRDDDPREVRAWLVQLESSRQLLVVVEEPDRYATHVLSLQVRAWLVRLELTTGQLAACATGSLGARVDSELLSDVEARAAECAEVAAAVDARQRLALDASHYLAKARRII